MDGQVVVTILAMFPMILAMLYAAYFGLDSRYVDDAIATLDLFQQAFVGINPKDSKKSGMKKATSAFHAKVFSNFSTFIKTC